MRVLQAFLDLLTDWAPACLLLGYYVRQCAWDLRRPGTGWQARQALVTSLVLMLRLDDWRGRRRMTEYIRTLSCALLCWTPWHDGLPACCFVEEANEAALSRLGRHFERHPQAVTTTEAMDLYLLVTPGRTDVTRDLHAGNVGEPWCAMVLGRVEALIDYVDGRPAPQFGGSASRLVTYIAQVRESREVLAHAEWPDDWSAASPPGRTYLDAGMATDLLRRMLRSLVKDATPDRGTTAALDALCARRGAADVDRMQRLVDRTVGNRPAVHRSRPVRPHPAIVLRVRIIRSGGSNGWSVCFTLPGIAHVRKWEHTLIQSICFHRSR